MNDPSHKLVFLEANPASVKDCDNVHNFRRVICAAGNILAEGRQGRPMAVCGSSALVHSSGIQTSRAIKVTGYSTGQADFPHDNVLFKI